MEVRFTPETEKRLLDFAQLSGRSTDDVIEDALAGYFDDAIEIRRTLDSRYDDLESGRVKPIDGAEFFERLRRREKDLLNKHKS